MLADLSDDGSRIQCRTEFRHRDLVSRIPGARWSRDLNLWQLPVTWSSCLALRAEFQHELEIGPALGAWAKAYRTSVIEPAMKLREAFDAEGDPDLFPHQRADVQFLATTERALLANEMGCIAGDTMMTVNRGGKSFQIRLSELVHCFNGGSRSGHRWRTDTPTRIGRHVSGVVRLATVTNAWESGIKTTYTLTTTAGRSIRATDEHPFQTPGGWRRLDELHAGDEVLVNVGKSTNGRTAPKKHYHQTHVMNAHPFHSRMGRARVVPTHRLIAEAGLNNLDPQVFIDKVRTGEIVGLTFLDSNVYAVHHADLNHLNNHPSNLMIMTHAAHHRLHAEISKTRSVLDQIDTETVESIVLHGAEMTYDIEVADDPHCFLANGFVVHNTGKTAAVVRTLVELSRRGEKVFPALVVCPNSVKRTWKREIEQWWPGITAQVVSGSAVQRRKQFRQPAHVYIINYESLRSHSRLIGYGDIALRRCVECGGEDPKVSVAQCHVHIRELNLIQFATVIADEAHRIKDPASMQTRAFKAAADGARFRYAMTGTPIANNRVDLWSILNFIDPTEWPTKTKWIDRLIDITYNVFGGIVFSGVKAGKQQEFDETINPRLRRMPKDAVLNLPPILPERRDVPMTSRQEKAYNEMAARMMAEMDGGELLITTSPLIQSMRLLQLASSFGELETRQRKNPDTGVLEDYDKLILAAPSSKIDAFMEDLPDYDGHSLLVFAVSRQLIMLLSETLTKKKIDHGLVTGGQPEWQRDENVQAFQAGRTKIILVTVAAGGTGLTLTAADTVVYLQRSWSMIDMDQSLARAHRIGSEIHSSITRIDYVCPDTLEESVIARLEGKTADLQDLVKDKEILAKAIRGKVVDIAELGMAV